MKIEIRGRKRWVTIAPGEYYVTKNQTVIATLLGSCVAACLFDPVNRVAGMNHFLLSKPLRKDQAPSYLMQRGRYGIHSMELLLNKMLSLGAERKHIQAKAFGGGRVLQVDANSATLFAVGDSNVKFINQFLKNERIPLISSALGGTVGRLIRYDTHDFSVYVKNISELSTAEIKNQEQFCLEEESQFAP